MAAGYRHRPPAPYVAGRARRAVSEIAAGHWALDVGGGHGFHAAAWAAVGYRAVVVDPAEHMLVVAGSHPGVHGVAASAELLPFRDASVGLVYFHLSIHYVDPSRALGEAARVLRTGGRVEIWTLTETHHRTSFLGRWFPSVPDIDCERFPTLDALRSALTDTGFDDMETSVEVTMTRRTAGDWVNAVRDRFVSTLQLIDPAEMDEGIERFLAAHPDPAELLEYELRFDRVTAVMGGRL